MSSQPVETASQRSGTRLPLEGVRVVDFCWVVAGPQMTNMLADLGAEVIKVESRTRMDGARLGRPMIGDDLAGGDAGAWPELQPLYHSMNRNKLAITLDMTQPRARDIIEKLCSISHAVTDNFSAGALARLGLGYERLREINPAIVALSISGTGQEGPMNDASTYAPLVVGLSGLGNLMGYEGEPPLGYMRGAYGDTHASLFSAFAIMAALYRARRTGVGDYLDVSQWETAVNGLEFHFLDLFDSGKARARGNKHPWFAPHGIYRCQGEDDWIGISCESDGQWRAICSVLGLKEAAENPRYAEAFDRLSSSDELDALIDSQTASWEKTQLATELQAAGVPAAPVMNIKDQYESPHFRERGIHVEASHPKIDYEVLQGLPWKTARAGRGEIRRAAPLIGQHNEFVFGELLGLSQDAIAELVEQKVIY
jgi:crotonobetainyl-CoA:carnitine CoA-transferase CaiB-like acyl-CoA transferase